MPEESEAPLSPAAEDMIKMIQKLPKSFSEDEKNFLEVMLTDEYNPSLEFVYMGVKFLVKGKYTHKRLKGIANNLRGIVRMNDEPIRDVNELFQCMQEDINKKIEIYRILGMEVIVKVLCSLKEPDIYALADVMAASQDHKVIWKKNLNQRRVPLHKGTKRPIDFI